MITTYGVVRSECEMLPTYVELDEDDAVELKEDGINGAMKAKNKRIKV